MLWPGETRNKTKKEGRERKPAAPPAAKVMPAPPATKVMPAPPATKVMPAPPAALRPWPSADKIWRRRAPPRRCPARPAQPGQSGCGTGPAGGKGRREAMQQRRHTLLRPNALRLRASCRGGRPGRPAGAAGRGQSGRAPPRQSGPFCPGARASRPPTSRSSRPIPEHEASVRCEMHAKAWCRLSGGAARWTA